MSKNVVKLLYAAKIGDLINRAVNKTSKGLALIHDAAVQTMLHAKKTGDVTLAARLMQEFKDNCKGVVVAGLAEWFKANSPIKLTVEEGQVKGKLLKKGEPGYKDFDTVKAEAEPAMESKAVAGRTDRPIEPMSLAMLKGRLKGLADQVEKAASEGGRGFDGPTPEMQAAQARICRTFVENLVVLADKIDLSAPAANIVENVTGKKDRKSARGQSTAAKAEARQAA